MITKKQLFLKQFGEHIRKIRLKKKLAQFDVACAMNKDRQNLQRLESGNINPTVFNLHELAEGLNTDIHTLTNFEYVPPKPKK